MLLQSTAAMRRRLCKSTYSSCAVASLSSSATITQQQKQQLKQQQYHTLQSVPSSSSSHVFKSSQQQQQQQQHLNNNHHNKKNHLASHPIRCSFHHSANNHQQQQQQQQSSSSSVNLSILMSFWKQYFIRYVIMTVIVIAILYSIYWISNMFSSINFKNVAKWSFYSGLIMGVGLSACSLFAKKYFTISSKTVYRVALKRVLDNAQVVQTLKAPIRPGKFRAYSYEYPDLIVSSPSSSTGGNGTGGNGNAASPDAVASNIVMDEDVPFMRKLQFWKPAHMQMMFQLTGASGKLCTVTCEVSRRSGIWNVLNNRFKFHSLAIDIPDDEDRIILKGTESHADQLLQQSTSSFQAKQPQQ